MLTDWDRERLRLAIANAKQHYVADGQAKRITQLAFERVEELSAQANWLCERVAEWQKVATDATESAEAIQRFFNHPNVFVRIWRVIRA